MDGRRHFIKAADGATVSYDLYQSMGRSSGKVLKTEDKDVTGGFWIQNNKRNAMLVREYKVIKFKLERLKSEKT